MTERPGGDLPDQAIREVFHVADSRGLSLTLADCEALTAAAAPALAAAERRRIHEASFDPDDENRLGLFKLAAADGTPQ